MFAKIILAIVIAIGATIVGYDRGTQYALLFVCWSGILYESLYLLCRVRYSLDEIAANPVSLIVSSPREVYSKNGSIVDAMIATLRGYEAHISYGSLWVLALSDRLIGDLAFLPDDFVAPEETVYFVPRPGKSWDNFLSGWFKDDGYFDHFYNVLCRNIPMRIIEATGRDVNVLKHLCKQYIVKRTLAYLAFIIGLFISVIASVSYETLEPPSISRFAFFLCLATWIYIYFNHKGRFKLYKPKPHTIPIVEWPHFHIYDFDQSVGTNDLVFRCACGITKTRMEM